MQDYEQVAKQAVALEDEIESLRAVLEELDETYSAAKMFDEALPAEFAEEQERAAALAVTVLSSSFEIVKSLREAGVEIEVAPFEDDALVTILANANLALGHAEGEVRWAIGKVEQLKTTAKG